MKSSEAGKGDTPRPVDLEKYGRGICGCSESSVQGAVVQE